MFPKGCNNYQANQVYQPSQGYPVDPTKYKEQQVDNIPGPSFEILDPVLLNVSKSVCKIRIDTINGFLAGSGFFLRFWVNGRFYYWLVTNEHVITKEIINSQKNVKVWYDIENKYIDLKLDQSERYIKTFKDNKVDATTVQIRSKDGVYKDYFLEPELGYDKDNLLGKEIFIRKSYISKRK